MDINGSLLNAAWRISTAGWWSTILGLLTKQSIIFSPVINLRAGHRPVITLWASTKETP